MPRANIDTLVTVIGGSGFLGRHIVRALAKRDYRIRVAVRRPELAGHLQPLGRVGQIHAVQANLRYPASIDAAMQDADVVINLVGVLFERGRQRFDTLMRDGAGLIAKSAAVARGARLIHVSAIGADANSTSAYARNKAEGEALVQGSVPDAVILRPSVVFGPEDDFFNRFAALARFLPVLPLVGGGTTRFQPVFVGDVAAAVAQAVDGNARPGVYELGGPEVLTMREILDYVMETTGRKRALIPLPFPLAKFKASILQFMPTPMLTPDQVELLRHDNVVSEDARRIGHTLQGLGIEPTSIEAVVPSYLWRYRKTGQFQSSAA